MTCRDDEGPVLVMIISVMKDRLSSVMNENAAVSMFMRLDWVR